MSRTKKGRLRGLKLRGEEEIFREAGNALSQVTDEDAKGWFQLCNYCLFFEKRSISHFGAFSSHSLRF